MSDRLRHARYVATCYLEKHEGIYIDVFDQFRGLHDLQEDENLLTAAALYTPVINERPETWEIQRGFGSDVYNLLLETTYDPDLSFAGRNRAIQNQIPRLSRRGKILQLAVLKAYLECDLSRVDAQSGDIHPASDYLDWLERILPCLAPDCIQLGHRFNRSIRFQRSLPSRTQTTKVMPELTRLTMQVFNR